MISYKDISIAQSLDFEYLSTANVVPFSLGKGGEFVPELT